MIELIQRVGGLPLALTLIGRHLLTHTYTGQPRRIYQRLLQLIWNVNERLSVQQYPSPWEQASTIPFGSPLSLQGTIATSYNTLSSQAQLALRTIAIFPPKPQSFSEEAALSICLIETEMLDELVDSGLITYQAPNRYQIHQTISDALRLLPLDPNIERRFQNYFLSYLYQYQHNLDKIEQELTSITTALEMITGETAVETFLLHIQALVPFLETRSLYNLAYTLFTRLQTMVEQQNEAKYIEQSQYYFDLLNAWQRNLAQGAQHDANRRFHLKELVSGS
jgi:hypothetical protein